MTSDLYVIIPTFNRSELLERTLNSLAKCEFPSNYRATILVENGPRMGAEAVVGGCPPSLRGRYMHVEMANKSNALNEALRDLPDEALVVFFDDDVRVAPDILVRYAKAAEGRGEGEYYGGPLEVDYETPPKESLVAYLPESAKGWRYDAATAKSPPVHFLGANWAAFAGDIRRLSGFDARVGPGGTSGAGGQEWNMHLRMFAAGIKPVYVPDALAWHYVPASRCTLRWAFDRYFRAGIYDGRQMRGQGMAAFLRGTWLTLAGLAVYIPGLFVLPLTSRRVRAAVVRRLWFAFGRFKGLLY